MLHATRICMNARLRVLPHKVLHRVLVHLQRVHKVLRVAPHAQRVAAPRIAARRLQIAWHMDQGLLVKAVVMDSESQHWRRG